MKRKILMLLLSRRKIKYNSRSVLTCLSCLIFGFIICYESIQSSHLSLIISSHYKIAKNPNMVRIKSKEYLIEPHIKCSCRKEQMISLRKEPGTKNLAVSLENSLNQDSTQYLYSIAEDEFRTWNVTCDLFKVLRRGRNQKVIAFSLYGSDEFYYKNLKVLTRQIRSLYPDWLIRIYYDRSVNVSVVCDIECTRIEDAGGGNELVDNVDFCDVTKLQFGLSDELSLYNASLMHPMMWRFMPINDNFVNVFLSRDSDSLVLQREVKAVDRWLSSNRIGHIMRDHPAHNVKILGGMWGLRSELDRKLASHIFDLMLDPYRIRKYNPFFMSLKGLDQTFLKDNVYRLIARDSVIHDSFHCRDFDEGQFVEAWPSQREGSCFVGLPSNDECKKNVQFKTECPKACRPKDHSNWIFC